MSRAWFWRLALVLCAVNPICALLVVEWEKEAFGILFQLIAFAFLIPLFACIQITAVFIVRKFTSPMDALLVLLISLCAAIDYCHFALTVDLASSSTAGVALVLYPITRQLLWIIPLGIVTLFCRYLIARRHED